MKGARFRKAASSKYPLSVPIGMVVDANNAYIAENDVDNVIINGENFISDRILKIPLTGGEPTTLATWPVSGTGPVADATNIYWTGGKAVMSVPKTGGELVTLASNPGWDTGFLMGPVIDATTAYFAINDNSSVYATTTRVMKVAKSGGTPVLVADHQHWIGSLAVDATNLYWVDPVTQTVVRHPK